MKHFIKLILIILAFTVCTGCSLTDGFYKDPNDNFRDESYSIQQSSSEIISDQNMESYENFSNFHNEQSKLLDPPFNRTIEKIDKNWNEEDILTAWNMTDASKVYKTYTDRLFCDLNNDKSNDLILTSYSTKKMYFFMKDGSDIKFIADYIDIDITNGYVIEPPTDKDTIQKCDVYDYQDDHLFKLYCINNNIFISGISWRSGMGKTCWIKKMVISCNKPIICDVFRWGMFADNTNILNQIFEYRKYDSDGQYSYTYQQEIENFLFSLRESALSVNS